MEFEHFHLEESETLNTDWVSTPTVIRTDKSLVVKDFFTANDTEVQMLRGQKFNRRAYSTLLSGSVLTAAATDFLIAITSLSLAPSVGLPTPSLVGVGKTFIVKDEVGGAATTTITIRSDGERTIDGASSTTLTTNYQAKSFYTDGSNWFIF